MIAAWRDIRGLRDPDCVDAWFRRLVVRACYRQARCDQRRSVVELRVVSDMPPISPGPELSVAERDGSTGASRGSARTIGPSSCSTTTSACLSTRWPMPSTSRPGPRSPGEPRDRSDASGARRGRPTQPRGRRANGMNDTRNADRLLAAWFESEAPASPPDALRTDIYRATAAIRPRPDGWAPERKSHGRHRWRRRPPELATDPGPGLAPAAACPPRRGGVRGLTARAQSNRRRAVADSRRRRLRLAEPQRLRACHLSPTAITLPYNVLEIIVGDGRHVGVCGRRRHERAAPGYLSR